MNQALYMMKSENIFEYNSVNYKEFFNDFRKTDTDKHSLIVLAGSFNTNRSAALNAFKREVIGDVVEIDLSKVITPYEEESYKNLDECVSSIKENTSLVIFKNPEQLNGAYTAFSSSVVKYATPQEKYFFNMIQAIPAPVIMEFKEIDELDQTLIRKAKAVILFKPPSSLLEKLAWKFQNMHVHGSRFLSHRPH